MKPYQVLSDGERFRCDLVPKCENISDCGSAGGAGRGTAASIVAMIRTLKSDFQHSGAVVVFDEFTSVVDRNVARVGSAASGQGLRRGQLPAASWQ